MNKLIMKYKIQKLMNSLLKDASNKGLTNYLEHLGTSKSEWEIIKEVFEEELGIEMDVV